MSETKSAPTLSLGIFQCLIGLSAIIGGGVLIADPTGAMMGLPLEWLNSTPFEDYFIPGLFLLFINGVASDVAGVLLILRRNPYAGEVAVLLGAILMLWIVLQVWWIGLVNWLQPIYFVLGFIELTLGFVVRRAMLESRAK